MIKLWTFLKLTLCILLCILLSVLLVVGCSSRQTQMVIPSEIEELISANRTLAEVDEEELAERFKELLYSFEDFEDEPETTHFSPGELVHSITVEEAIEDVNHMFQILKYGYAAYEFFGGDEAFLNAREAITHDINKKLDVLSTSEFNRILVRHLDFIQDGHFGLGNTTLYKRYNYYTSETYSFLKDEEGFFTLIDDEKYYLIAILEGEVEDFIKLSLSEEGEIVYFLGSLYPSQSTEHRVNITLQSESEIINRTVSLRIATLLRDRNLGTVYRFTENNQIPMIQIRSMDPKTENQVELLTNFVDDARKLRNKEHFIIDLRGNSGGYEFYPNRWINNYSRQAIRRDVIGSNLDTKTTIAALKGTLESVVGENHRQDTEKFVEDVVEQDWYPGWSNVFYGTRGQINNPNIIFVLLDGAVASAGETFVEMLRQMNNVIFIGENTQGVRLVGNNYYYVLPNSEMHLYFGRTLLLNQELQSVEGTGLMPDFWISPDHALERTLKFFERYFK